MPEFDGQYSGAALKAFILGLERSQVLIEQILKAHGLERIDEGAWYSIKTAQSIYRMVGAQIGDASLHMVGLKMIHAARFPPEVKDARTALSGLNAAYRLNARGPNIGYIKTTLEEERTAFLVYARPFPCALTRGILQGCCKKYGERALIEHGLDGCVDKGAPACTYRVSW
jgi:hypothetical protein